MDRSAIVIKHLIAHKFYKNQKQRVPAKRVPNYSTKSDANIDGNSIKAVGSYRQNAFGLYDMHGNVWEWCEDKYDYNAYQKELVKGTIQNPEGSKVYYDTGEQLAPKHVMRGGSFLCNDSYCASYRVSSRMATDPNTSLEHLGFRTVTTVTATEK